MFGPNAKNYTVVIHNIGGGMFEIESYVIRATNFPPKAFLTVKYATYITASSQHVRPLDTHNINNSLTATFKYHLLIIIINEHAMRIKAIKNATIQGMWNG